VAESGGFPCRMHYTSSGFDVFHFALCPSPCHLDYTDWQTQNRATNLTDIRRRPTPLATCLYTGTVYFSGPAALPSFTKLAISWHHDLEGPNGSKQTVSTSCWHSSSGQMWLTAFGRRCFACWIVPRGLLAFSRSCRCEPCFRPRYSTHMRMLVPQGI